MAKPYFTAALFRYLNDLADHNDRTWFKAHADRFEAELREPSLRFITDFGPHLGRISHSFRADPRKTGGSLFRIYRDTRFSKDKAPYKTHAGLHFRHERGKDAYTPGFYLHLQPGASFVGVGLWHPDSATLKKIRAHMDARPDRWKRAIGNRGFTSRFRLDGECLKTRPQGYPADHPLIEDLRRKDLTAFVKLTRREILAGDFLQRFAADCAAGASLVAWLCEALELEY